MSQLVHSVGQTSIVLVSKLSFMKAVKIHFTIFIGELDSLTLKDTDI